MNEIAREKPVSVETIATTIEGIKHYPERLLAVLGERASRIASITGTSADAEPSNAVQVPTYHLVRAFANTIAARSLIDYATLSQETDPVMSRVAATHAAELLLSEHRKNSNALGNDTEVKRFEHSAERLTSYQMLSELGSATVRQGNRLPIQHYSDDVEMMRDTFARFSRSRIYPVAQEIHRSNGDVPQDIIDELAELGCFGISVPEEYGGLLSESTDGRLGVLVATEELSKASLGAAGSLMTRPEVVVGALVAGGTDAQKRRWLPEIASGNELCAVAVTEPGAGSDVASISLSATATNGGWLLDGAKMWCTFAGRASLLLVLARTEADDSRRHRGLSFFLVTKPSSFGEKFSVEQSGGGLLEGRAIPTIGYRGMHSFELRFDRFFVPDDCLLGSDDGLGNGFYFCMKGFSGGRLQTTARAVGIMQAAYEGALNYAVSRSVFGAAIADYPLTGSRFIQMQGKIIAARQLSYEVATGRTEFPEEIASSIAKLFACRAAEEVTRDALQVFGGLGYAEESSASRYFVDARVLSIFEGTEEVLALRVIGPYLYRTAAERESEESEPGARS